MKFLVVTIFSFLLIFTCSGCVSVKEYSDVQCDTHIESTQFEIDSVKETEYSTEASVYDMVVPDEIIWYDGEVPNGYIGIEPTPIINKELHEVIATSSADSYIAIFVKNFTSCGLVPRNCIGVNSLPENMKSDTVLLQLIDNADMLYNEYSKTLECLLAQGKKLYEVFDINEFVLSRDKALTAYMECIDYVKRECEKYIMTSFDDVSIYKNLYYNVEKGDHINMMEVRHTYFSSFGFIPYYNIEYQIDNYDSYYGQGVEIDPGYIYVAKGGDIELFATILGDKSSVIKLYPITKEFAEMHKTLFE